MFYYKTSLSQKAIFSEKTAKNPFVGGYDRFEGRRASGHKNQYNLFCRVLNIFYFTIFFEKNNIFHNNAKINFWRA